MPNYSFCAQNIFNWARHANLLAAELNLGAVAFVSAQRVFDRLVSQRLKLFPGRGAERRRIFVQLALDLRSGGRPAILRSERIGVVVDLDDVLVGAAAG